MFTGLVSFLGGSAFRMIWGEASAWFTAKQEHAFEIERIEAQEKIDAAQHLRNQEAIKLQSELGIKTIESQLSVDLSKIEASAWSNAVDAVGKTSGIVFVDVWNGVIRPLLATLSIIVIVFEIARNGFVLSDWDKELVGAILGLYVADRSLIHRGK